MLDTPQDGAALVVRAAPAYPPARDIPVGNSNVGNRPLALVSECLGRVQESFYFILAAWGRELPVLSQKALSQAGGIADVKFPA